MSNYNRYILSFVKISKFLFISSMMKRILRTSKKLSMKWKYSFFKSVKNYEKEGRSSGFSLTHRMNKYNVAWMSRKHNNGGIYSSYEIRSGKENHTIQWSKPLRHSSRLIKLCYKVENFQNELFCQGWRLTAVKWMMKSIKFEGLWHHNIEIISNDFEMKGRFL